MITLCKAQGKKKKKKTRSQCYFSENYSVLPLNVSYTYKGAGSQIRNNQNVFVNPSRWVPAISPTRRRALQKEVSFIYLVFLCISLLSGKRIMESPSLQKSLSEEQLQSSTWPTEVPSLNRVL